MISQQLRARTDVRLANLFRGTEFSGLSHDVKGTAGTSDADALELIAHITDSIKRRLLFDLDEHKRLA